MLPDSIAAHGCRHGLSRPGTAQARVLQGRYVFGATAQIVSALGLHRRKFDQEEKVEGRWVICRITGQTTWPCGVGSGSSWVAYTIDKYLSVVFGRLGHYHDDGIDQGFPDWEEGKSRHFRDWLS